jgi:hypothetical protein
VKEAKNNRVAAAAETYSAAGTYLAAEGYSAAGIYPAANLQHLKKIAKAFHYVHFQSPVASLPFSPLFSDEEALFV